MTIMIVIVDQRPTTGMGARRARSMGGPPATKSEATTAVPRLTLIFGKLNSLAKPTQPALGLRHNTLEGT
jgi:hypothetical protein